MATSKKIKQSSIDTPLDGGTFISLQKSSNESDLSMETKLHLLYKLQQTDSELDRIMLLRGGLPLEVQDLEDDIEGLKTRVENIQKEIKDTEKIVAQKKLDLESAKSLVAKYTEQQNNVKNNREYDSITKEIEFQNLEVQLSEKKIKEGASLIADKKAVLSQNKSLLDDRKKDLTVKKKELDVIVEETEKEERSLLGKSEEIQSQIDERMLAAYHKVRNNSRNGLAVVTVKRDACAGCFNKIPPQRKMDISSNKKIIVCEYCGRILVSAEFECE